MGQAKRRRGARHTRRSRPLFRLGPRADLSQLPAHSPADHRVDIDLCGAWLHSPAMTPAFTRGCALQKPGGYAAAWHPKTMGQVSGPHRQERRGNDPPRRMRPTSPSGGRSRCPRRKQARRTHLDFLDRGQATCKRAQLRDSTVRRSPAVGSCAGGSRVCPRRATIHTHGRTWVPRQVRAMLPPQLHGVALPDLRSRGVGRERLGEVKGLCASQLTRRSRG